MAKNISDEKRKRLRIIILAFVGVFAFVVSVGMNIVGMRNAINRAPDSSGMAGFSVRSNQKDSLVNTKSTKKDDEGKLQETDIYVRALPLVFLKNNNWDRIQAKFTGFKLDENGNAIFDEGYTLYCNGKYVNYVVFNDNYKEDVVKNIKVGTDFKTIEKELGTPTFKNSNSIGYKTREVYVFFYENEISVYPNRKISNDEFEKKLLEYAVKSYSNRTRFVVDIRENFEDCTFEQDVQNDIVIITSTTRQVMVKLDRLDNIEVEFYNGYTLSNDSTKSFIEKNIFKTNENDLVEIVENERVSGK